MFEKNKTNPVQRRALQVPGHLSTSTCIDSLNCVSYKFLQFLTDDSGRFSRPAKCTECRRWLAPI